MPSPFPGMDPFLEHPDIFPDLHGRLHVYISEALQQKLPAPYFAVICERLWVENSSRHIEPDTDVLHTGGVDVASELSDQGNGGVAVEVAAKVEPLIFEVTDEERRESFVEIRTKRKQDGEERVVTTIEVLSLSNKMPGEKGQELYWQKQEEVLSSPIHLVEIDLLRGGVHTTPMSLERLEMKAGSFDYHVSIHRFNERTRFYVYPWSLADPLPEIAIPLLPGDGDVLLDLQAVFGRCYETGPYRRRIDYQTAPVIPPLDDAQREWVEERLRSAKTV